MNFEKIPSPEERSKIHKERILSDAELIKGGAYVNPEGIIVPSDEQQKDAKVEMGDHFYKKYKQLSEGNEDLTDSLRKEKNKNLKWWRREYKDYGTAVDNYDMFDFAEVETYLKTKTEDDIKKILNDAENKSNMRFMPDSMSLSEYAKDTIKDRVRRYFKIKKEVEKKAEKENPGQSLAA